MALLGWIANLGFGGGNDGSATPPVTTFTGIVLLSSPRGQSVIIGTSAATPNIVTVQLVRPSFPYTFPIDFNEHEAGRVYGGGRVRILSG